METTTSGGMSDDSDSSASESTIVHSTPRATQTDILASGARVCWKLMRRMDLLDDMIQSMMCTETDRFGKLMVRELRTSRDTVLSEGRCSETSVINGKKTMVYMRAVDSVSAGKLSRGSCIVDSVHKELKALEISQQRPVALDKSVRFSSSPATTRRRIVRAEDFTSSDSEEEDIDIIDDDSDVSSLCNSFEGLSTSSGEELYGSSSDVRRKRGKRGKGRRRGKGKDKIK